MSTPTHPTGSHDLNDTYEHELDQTIGSLESGVTSISIDVGIRIIDAWYDALKNADRDDLNEIANLLADLRDELTGDRLDGRTIGDLLVRLGDETTSAAANADDTRLTPTLERLATVLTSAGQALGGRDVESHRPEVGAAELDPDSDTSGFGGTSTGASAPGLASDPTLAQPDRAPLSDDEIADRERGIDRNASS